MAEALLGGGMWHYRYAMGRTDARLMATAKPQGLFVWNLEDLGTERQKQ